jgi:hypothetical protein
MPATSGTANALSAFPLLAESDRLLRNAPQSDQPTPSSARWHSISLKIVRHLISTSCDPNLGLPGEIFTLAQKMLDTGGSSLPWILP